MEVADEPGMAMSLLCSHLELLQFMRQAIHLIFQIAFPIL